MAERCREIHPRSGMRCILDIGHDGAHKLVQIHHHCHAVGCFIPTKPEMLMCLRHWRMVPKAIQRQVWATYRPGQCDDKNPRRDWHAAADAAIRAVANKESKSEVER